MILTLIVPSVRETRKKCINQGRQRNLYLLILFLMYYITYILINVWNYIYMAVYMSVSGVMG